MARPLPRPVLLFLFALLCSIALAAQQPRCNGTCEPDPLSTTYAQNIAPRPQPPNQRGKLTPLAANTQVAAQDSAVHPGSQSHDYVIPVLSLPGRNGLDVNLALYYNSRAWTIDSVNSTATFDADRDVYEK